MRRSKDVWQRLGAEARSAHEAVTAAFKAKLRETAPVQYDALLIDFHTKTTAALPSSDLYFLPNLAAGNAAAIETAIAFLEADPWFFRSGYEKKRLIRELKRSKLLTRSQRDRLGRVVLGAIDHRDFDEFRAYCQLACGVWSATLDAEVAERLESPNPGIRRRATWVARAAVSAGKA